MKKLTGETIRSLPKKKKMLISGVAVVAGVAVLGAGVAAYASNTVQKNVIGSDAAVSIALDDANVSAQAARIDDVDLVLRQGTLVYDVEFEADRVDYDYEIKASDGTILNRQAEADGEKVSTTAETTTAAAGGSQATGDSASQTTAAQNSAGVTLDSAKSIALKHAGLSASDVRFTKAKTDYDDGVKEYDIEFISGSYEYEFEVRASDGKITSYDRERADAQKTTSSQKITSSQSSSSAVTLAEAKSIALKHAGLSASDVRFTKAKTDYDDGVKEYDIEFVSGSYEYEFEVRASDGKITSYDRERAEGQKTTSASTTSSGNYIGVEKAKSIALKDSGVSASKATFEKAKLDKEDGVYVYEVEFRSGNMEYEYEINAKTGKILDRSVEREDR